MTVHKTGRDWARPVVHWVIHAVDVDAQRAFYEALFQWNVEDGFFPMIDAGLGGPEPGPAGHFEPRDTPGVSLWIQVRDLRETLDRAVELGGAIDSEPFDVPGGPTLAAIRDPEGNPVGLVQQ